MKQLLLFLVIIFLGITQTEAELTPSKKQIDAIETLRKLAANRGVSHIEVYNMPWYNAASTAFTVDTLKTNAQYKLGIYFAETQITKWRIVNALKNTKEDNRTYAGDLRWGFVFFDGEEKEVFSVYATGMCKVGVMQGRLVKFDPLFWVWVKQRFGVTFDQNLE